MVSENELLINCTKQKAAHINAMLSKTKGRLLKVTGDCPNRGMVLEVRDVLEQAGAYLAQIEDNMDQVKRDFLKTF